MDDLVDGVSIPELVEFTESIPEIWPPEWEPKQMIVFNIPREHFEVHAFPKTYGELGYSSRLILQLWARTITRPRFGTEFKDDCGIIHDFYCRNKTPKILVIIEELIDDNSARTYESFENSAESISSNRCTYSDDFCAMRVWIFSLDEKFKLDKGFEESLNQNKLARHGGIGNNNLDAGSGNRNGSDNSPFRSSFAASLASGKTAPETSVSLVNQRKKKKWDQSCDKVKDTETLLTHILKEYLGLSDVTGYLPNLDALHSPEYSLSNRDGKMSPFKIFSVQNAMDKCHVDRVCRRQKDISEYFDINHANGQVQPCTWKGKFPYVNRVYKIHTPFFETKSLYYAPLPSFVRVSLKKKQDELKQICDDIESLYLTKNDQPADSIRRAEIEEEISEMRRKTINLRADIENIQAGLLMKEEQFEMGLLTGTTAMKKMINDNEFMQLREVNKERCRNISAEFDENSDEFANAMNAFYKMSINEFWTVFNKSKKITKGAQEAMKFFLPLSNENKWMENGQMINALSPFGNMIVRMMSEFDFLFRVDTNFNLLLIGLFTMLCSFRYYWGLRPNLLVSGAGAAGKSFILEVLEVISMPGSVLNVSHVTEHAFNSNTDMSDVCMFFHETPGRLLGIDKFGKEVASDPFFKGRLTSQMSITVHQIRDSANRDVKTSISRNMGGVIGCTNEKLPSNETAILTRFIRANVMSNKVRHDRSKNSSLFMASWTEDDSIGELIKHGKRLHHFYLFLWEKAIEAGVLPEIDEDECKVVTQFIMDELQKERFPLPEVRQIKMYFQICRIITMYYGVEMELFSELGLRHRQNHKTGKPNPFDPMILREFIKWGVINQEVTTFGITLMESIWMDPLKFNIVDIISNQINKWCGNRFASEKDLHSSVTVFRNGIDVGYDYNYIGFRMRTFAQAVSKLIHLFSNVGCGEPSYNNVVSMLYTLSRQFLPTKKKELLPVADNLVDGQATCYSIQNIDSQETQSACVILEDPKNTPDKMCGVWIHVDMIGVNFNNIFHRIIPRALEHRNQPPETYITAIPYARHVDTLGRW